MKLRREIFWVVVLLLITGGCKKKEEKGEEMKSEASGVKGAVSAPEKPDVSADKKYTAVIKTTKGEIRVELYPKEAPFSVTNFVMLAEKNFYDGLTFHRVVPDFVVQGGDPTGTGTGGPGYTMPAEIQLPHKEGALAWARLPDTVNPQKRSSGSQFYITHKATPFLDGEYTVFGQTISGMDVVHQIQQGDIIQDIAVTVE